MPCYQKISDAKDTLREFKGYVDEFDTRKKEGRLRYPGNEAYEADDNQDGEEDYVEADVHIVRTCIQLFEQAREAMVCGLKALTFVGDNISDSYHEQEILIRQNWIAQCSLNTKTFLDLITNVGAELYPPLDAEEIGVKYEEARLFADRYLRTLIRYNEVYDTELRDNIQSILNSSIIVTTVDFRADN